jgi:hypothetical protein
VLAKSRLKLNESRMRDDTERTKREEKRKESSRWATIVPRGMTKDEAAEYCGCETKGAFDTWIQKGIVPGPIPGTQRWDRKAIDVWLDRASEIETSVTPVSTLEQWKAMRERKKRGES